MRRGPAGIGAGVAVGGVYLALAWHGGSFRPLAGPPVYDGLSPPPPYQWVDPPPDLAAGNVPAMPGTGIVDFSEEGSEPIVFSTGDLQVSLAFPAGAIAPMDGQESVRVDVTPLAPDGFERAPGRLEIKGNVYRIDAVYEPGGRPVDGFATAVQMSMIYPAEPNGLTGQLTILMAPEGGPWSMVETLNSPARHQALAEIARPADYAVGGPRPATPFPTRNQRIVLVVVAAILALALALFQWWRWAWRCRAAGAP